MINRLKIKHWLFLLFFTICISLFHGCGYDINDMAAFGFIESEQVVEVGADTKSFRIVVKWSDEGKRDVEYHTPRAWIDTTKTTARHNVHFINYVHEYDHIGDFTRMDSDEWYRDVELLPEKITSEVIIYYDINQSTTSHSSNMIERLKVILRPKANN